MQHLDEDTLVLYVYDEVERPQEVAAHLQRCPACRDRHRRLLDDLEQLQDLSVPDPGAGYPSQVWLRLRGELAPHDRRRVPVWRRGWFRLAAAAVLVLAGFLAGLLWRQPTTPTLQADAGASRRVYLAAVSQHLSRAQVLLLEVTHTPESGEDSLAGDAKRAGQLVADNRVFRMTAVQRDDPRVAALLEELERVLQEIANQGDGLPPEDLDALRQRIDSQALVFKARAVGERLEQDLRSNSTLKL